MLHLCVRSVSALGSNGLKALFSYLDGLFRDTIAVPLFPPLRFRSFSRNQLKVLSISALLVLAIVSVAGIISPKTTYAASGINQELSFEGKIVSSSGTNITDGTYNVEF